jgi:hypothetical protein
LVIIVLPFPHPPTLHNFDPFFMAFVH